MDISHQHRYRMSLQNLNDNEKEKFKNDLILNNITTTPFGIVKNNKGIQGILSIDMNNIDSIFNVFAMNCNNVFQNTSRIKNLCCSNCTKLKEIIRLDIHYRDNNKKKNNVLCIEEKFQLEQNKVMYMKLELEYQKLKNQNFELKENIKVIKKDYVKVCKYSFKLLLL